MARSVLISLIVLVVLPGCLLEGDDIGDDPPGQECVDQLCVTPEHPFRFGVIPRLGVGTELQFKLAAHSLLGRNFEIAPSDPSIELVKTDAGRFVRPHAAGQFALIARDIQTQAELGRISFTTADVAAFGFAVRVSPIAPDPIDAIAVVSGGVDEIGVAFRDVDGVELAGTAPVVIEDATIVGARAPGWHLLDGPFERMRFGIVGKNLGTTRATVTLFDGRSATLPIETVASPATIELAMVTFRPDRIVPVTGVVDVDQLVSVGVVGKTSDGRFVAGVSAGWHATGPVQVAAELGAPRTPEVQLQPTAPGTIEISALFGDATAAATLTVR